MNHFDVLSDQDTDGELFIKPSITKILYLKHLALHLHFPHGIFHYEAMTLTFTVWL